MAFSLSRWLRILLIVVLLGVASWTAFWFIVGTMFERAVTAITGGDDTVLSTLDPAQGPYRLVVRTIPAEGGDARIWLIDDQAALQQYRDAVDVTFHLTEWLPGEGRGDYYLYVYRGQERVAGRGAPNAHQIKVPPALLDMGRPLRLEERLLPREPFLQALAAVRARPDTLVREADTPDADPAYEHDFEVIFPTIAVALGSGFDVDAYGEQLAQRVQQALPGIPLRLAHHYADPHSLQILDDAGDYQRDASGTPIELAGIALYTVHLQWRGTPAAQRALHTLDLTGYVADHVNMQGIGAAWMAATRNTKPPRSMTLANYTNRAHVGPAYEREYRLSYWEAVR